MKLLLLGASLFTGGGAVAMENETINEAVTNTATQIKVMIQKKLQGNLFETVQESGFPYPSEEYLVTLTEDQAFEIISAIDVINATYDWQNMTDEEIIDALAIIKTDMQELYLALGIEGPATQTKTQTRTRQGGNGKGGNTQDFNPNGTQDGTCTEVVPTDVPTDAA